MANGIAPFAILYKDGAKMIYECNIIMDNEAVTVVECNGEKIQFPHMETNSKRLFVAYNNGKYALLDNKPNEENPKNIQKTKKIKETTGKDKKQAETPDCEVVL